MPEARMFYSRPILEAIVDGTVYSDLLCDRQLIAKHGKIHDLTDAVQKLVDLGAIRMVPHWTPEEGDDFRMYLTDRGRFLRRYTDD